MCNDFFQESECKEFCDQRKTIVARDSGNQQEYRVTNQAQQEVCKIRVDGCLIRDQDGKKCDFLILFCASKLAFFVELKGHSLIEAIQQINVSVDKLKLEMPDFTFYARIVLNRTPTPDINSSDEIKLRKKLKKLNSDNNVNKNIELISYKSKVLEETI